jgi:hypothetical protein
MTSVANCLRGNFVLRKDRILTVVEGTRDNGAFAKKLFAYSFQENATLNDRLKMR